MRIKSQKDFFAGLLYMLTGIAFAWGATNYNIGDGARMGPGYFPLLLGIVLAVIGGIVLFQSLVVETPDGDKIGKWAWKPLLFIIASNFLFGILLGGWPALGIPAMGLIIAIFVLTFVAALAGTEFRFVEVLILAILLAALSWFAFVWGLKLQFQVWPTFITG
ncbi:tripartite tricarboxylate transporter TctB family protein [Ottowia sp.]|uniref:tripartite tricarboxylate transporter TctB family protein n=1 Tax=Ottowia sp. TaxID=1898956 RepID=UPI002B7FC8AE|nr:tripartite tricarboxylate transporter TctB family protein [Ottowia sp.]HOB66665.1 tripartite tricarboxylate transporter TctB family protein [Ottowia sp.]HPZ57582.1 tripartite tricarboxylate transporter TctB family protein [Ottowia sp.]HQD47054.1 tripartite tricarboxylate transporter TctB family protein [Ottowia sp.]